ncbi:short-chain dehydrogenase [Xylariaceae sp. FL1272]|nr:short-chain dehydrogenase [Xylariaceae sp. FL1272]
MASSIDANSIFRVDGMVAVITGGGTGIGLYMARALALNGAKKVYILGRRLEVLEEAAKEYQSLVPLKCDVASKDDLQQAVDFIEKDAGHVNLLVANSGIVGKSPNIDPQASLPELRKRLFADSTMESMDEPFRVNVTSAFFTMTAFLELLDAGNKKALEGGFGRPTQQGIDVPSIQSQVIFTASISGFSRHWVSSPAYCASKAAILQLAKFSSSQLARFGIRVNALAPGVYPSAMTGKLSNGRKPEEEAVDHPFFIPARRFGGEEEMAGAILYLASRSGSYSNGLVLLTDGGRLSVMGSTY